MESKQLMSRSEAFSSQLGFALKREEQQAAPWYRQRRLVLGMAPHTQQLLQQHPDTRRWVVPYQPGQLREQIPELYLESKTEGIITR